VKLSGVRQELRPWAGGGWGEPARPHPDLFAQQIAPVSKDRAQVLRELARMQPLVFHPWLEAERAIPRGLLLDPRFAGRIKVDFRANTIFPHADQDGPCGYEIKNRSFTGFARGGDTALVIAESGIDALSYAALHPDKAARYASTGGTMNPNQPALLQAAIAKLGQGARLIIATDNDPGGRSLADQIAALARETGREDLVLIRDLPAGEGEDWNDVLRASPAQDRSRAAPNPVR
jgi:hypothetical protein